MFKEPSVQSQTALITPIFKAQIYMDYWQKTLVVLYRPQSTRKVHSTLCWNSDLPMFWLVLPFSLDFNQTPDSSLMENIIHCCAFLFLQRISITKNSWSFSFPYRFQRFAKQFHGQMLIPPASSAVLWHFTLILMLCSVAMIMATHQLLSCAPSLQAISQFPVDSHGN